VLSEKMLMFLVSTSCDVAEAEAALDALGDKALESDPVAPLSLSWVVRAVRRGQAWSAWVSAYCDDEALEFLSGDTRRSVLSSVAARRVNDASVLDANEETVRAALESATSYFLRYGGLGAIDREKYFSLVLTSPLAGVTADQLILGLSTLGAMGEVQAFFRARFDTRVGTSEGEVWRASTVELCDVLAALPARGRSKLVTELLQQSSSNNWACNFSARDTVALMAARSGMGTFGEERMIFSEEGVDLILENPKWHLVLRAQRVTEAQWRRMLELDTAALRGHLDGHLERSGSRLASLRERYPDYSRRKKYAHSALLSCVNDADDTTAMWVLENLEPYNQFAVLYGLHFERVHLSRAQMTWLLAVMGADELGFSKIKGLSRAYTEEETSYAHQMIDLLPGLALAACSTGLWSGYILSRLESCGVSTDLALSTFEQQGETQSLQKICNTLSALGRGRVAPGSEWVSR
jgi:hypothetical protein